jgi:membrane protease YdiL (CAAX protease family)
MLQKLNTPKGEKKNREPLYIWIYIILFFAVQSAYAAIYAGSGALRNDTLLQLVIRLATWTLPVFAYLVAYRTEPFGYLKLRKGIVKGILWGVIIGTGIVLANIALSFAQKGGVRFDLDIGADNWIRAILLVGFSEDVLFRGFILQKLAGMMRFGTANALSAVLFALVHVIGWCLTGQFVLPGILTSVAYVFLFAVLQGFVLKKTDSLWACIVIHSFNNFISIALAS